MYFTFSQSRGDDDGLFVAAENNLQEVKFDGGVKKIGALTRFESKALCYNSSDNGKYVVLALRDLTICVYETLVDKVRIFDLPPQLKVKSTSREAVESKHLEQTQLIS